MNRGVLKKDTSEKVKSESENQETNMKTPILNRGILIMENVNSEKGNPKNDKSEKEHQKKGQIRKGQF